MSIGKEKARCGVDGEHEERQVRFGANSVALGTLLGCALCHASSTEMARRTVSCNTNTKGQNAEKAGGRYPPHMVQTT
jgi:hypothetical protein